jgi:hypothetical protein
MRPGQIRGVGAESPAWCAHIRKIFVNVKLLFPVQEFKVSKNIFQNQENLQIVTNLEVFTPSIP